MKTQNPFTGRSAGSLANVTASTYCGKNILKSKPLEVRNPQTAKQVNVRNVLAQAAILGKSLSAVNGIAKRSARTGRMSQKTARTAIISAILAKKTGTAPEIVLRRDGISLQGSGISKAQAVVAELNHTTGNLAVAWADIPPTGSLGTDIASCVIFDLNSGTVETFSDTIKRDEGQLGVLVTSPVVRQSSNLGLFLMFDSADGLRYDAVESVTVSML